MAEANRSSFLGAINPWSRSSTPPPKSPRNIPAKQDLKPASATDHASIARPTPSLRRYPKDCPALKTRWYYAVDVAKRKPFVPEPAAEDKDKAKVAQAPKKFVNFSASDSQAIEDAFQALGREDENGDKQTSTRVPVNEDYLYDVHVEKRELEPAYWLGPVFEVRRGSWFYQESPLRACDENLANQLEEGYLKVAPWRNTKNQRSASQPRHRSTSISDHQPPMTPTTEASTSNTYRLFGAYMNTTVMYLDGSGAYLSSDDLLSRIGSTVYGSFGGRSGIKVVRGYSEPIEAAKSADVSLAKDKLKATTKTDAPNKTEQDAADSISEAPAVPPPRPSALERQLSSLAGLTRVDSHDQHRQEEEEAARVEEQKEMEDAREKDGEDQARKIDHLVLVTHGIGQRLGLRLDSINFVHDVNTMRKTMKAAFDTAPDLQALSGNSKNCSIQVLPICWRHLLDFPKQSLKQNRKEHDLGDADISLDDDYPSLQDITVDGVPAVRNLITDLALDVLLYQSAYREHIAKIVTKEVNRVYQLFKKRTGFNGKVSLCGHSLGSAVYFDILCRQPEEPKTRPRRVSSKTTRDTVPEDQNILLDFNVENFFAVGSPIALFQMLKGRTIAGRSASRDQQAPPISPFDPDPMQQNPFSSVNDRINPNANLIPITTSSPKCSEFFNIFHPTDPIAYRVEPLISPAMSSLKSQALPYTKRGLFAAPGMANLTARVGQQVMSGWYNLTSGVASSLINRSLGITGEEQALPQDKQKVITTRDTLPQLQTGADLARANTTPVAVDSSRLQDVAESTKAQSAAAGALGLNADSNPNPTLIDSEMETLYSGFQKRRRSAGSSGSAEPSGLEFELEQEKARRLKREEAKVRALNSNGRVDYHVQEGLFDVSLLASIASHLSYWADADVNHFMIGQMLKKGTRAKDTDRDRDKAAV